MMSRRWLALIPLGLLGLIPFAGMTGPDAAAGIRRVVVIHLDTTRVDDLGCYGSVARTPNIDAVAARGMRYTNSIATSPKTAPSIASFMTGRVANTHGVYDVGGKLDERLTTLAEILRDHGFATGGFTSNATVGRIGDDPHRSPGFDQGFDVYETMTVTPEVPEDAHENAVPRAESPPLVSRALEFVERHAEDRFFLWMLHVDPHAPYAPPPPYDTMYLDDPRLTAGSVELSPANIHFQAYVPSRLRSHEYVARHLGEVSHTDFQLGRLLDRIDALPGRSLIVITSDHGESLGDAGYWFSHGANIRHPCVNVPLVIAADGVVPRGVSDALVANIDLAPTILDLLDLPAWPLGRNGRSLARTFHEADPWPDRMIPIQTYDGAKWRGVRGARFCLHSRFRIDSGQRALALLYDLETDPKETTDVAAAYPEVLDTYVAFEDDWFSRPALNGPDLRHDPEMIRQLRSLGYVR